MHDWLRFNSGKMASIKKVLQQWPFKSPSSSILLRTSKFFLKWLQVYQRRHYALFTAKNPSQRLLMWFYGTYCDFTFVVCLIRNQHDLGSESCWFSFKKSIHSCMARHSYVDGMWKGIAAIYWDNIYLEVSVMVHWQSVVSQSARKYTCVMNTILPNKPHTTMVQTVVL